MRRLSGWPACSTILNLTNLMAEQACFRHGLGGRDSEPVCFRITPCWGGQSWILLLTFNPRIGPSDLGSESNFHPQNGWQRFEVSAPNSILLAPRIR
jgi:hypothetical protein